VCKKINRNLLYFWLSKNDKYIDVSIVNSVQFQSLIFFCRFVFFAAPKIQGVLDKKFHTSRSTSRFCIPFFLELLNDVVEFFKKSASMKLELYLRFQKTEYSMEDDVPVNNETYVMILSISKPAKSISWTQSIRDAHRSRIYIRSFIGVSVYTYL
jgi:hypothetical protein